MFLDIQGVLYNKSSLIHSKVEELFPESKSRRNYHYNIAATHYFDPKAVAHLETLLEKTPNVGIVISSSWRMGYNLEALREIFSLYNFSKFIIGKTPDDLSSDGDGSRVSAFAMRKFTGRALEIACWLENHPEVVRFVILDDYDSGLSKGFPAHFIETDARKLLTEDDVAKAFELLDLQKNLF